MKKPEASGLGNSIKSMEPITQDEEDTLWKEKGLFSIGATGLGQARGLPGLFI